MEHVISGKPRPIADCRGIPGAIEGNGIGSRLRQRFSNPGAIRTASAAVTSCKTYGEGQASENRTDGSKKAHLRGEPLN
jgi:hypothetical protein